MEGGNGGTLKTRAYEWVRGEGGRSSQETMNILGERDGRLGALCIVSTANVKVHDYMRKQMREQWTRALNMDVDGAQNDDGDEWTDVRMMDV